MFLEVENYNVSERTFRVGIAIIRCRKTTRGELAERFRVSTKTIDRAIEVLGEFIPIRTAQGRGGGVFIMQDHELSRKYLSEEQIMCLVKLKRNADENTQNILDSIIKDFSIGGA